MHPSFINELHQLSFNLAGFCAVMWLVIWISEIRLSYISRNQKDKLEDETPGIAACAIVADTLATVFGWIAFILFFSSMFLRAVILAEIK